MNLIRTLLLGFGLLLVTLKGYANQAEQALDSQLKNLRSLQADFVQTIRAADDRVLQQSSGSMALQRPGKFRWFVKEPNKQLIIANNRKLWIYDEDLAQVTIQLVNKTQNTPAFLLSDDNQRILRKFAVTELKTHRASVKNFLLQPKTKDNLFSSLQLNFENTNLAQIIMTDALGQVTTIKFTSVRADKTLDSKLFEFTMPAGVEIIDQTRA